MDKGAGRSDREQTKLLNGRNYLLTIAIDRYLHWHKLQNAVKDVEDITDLLITHYQFDASYIKHIHNELATERNILEALNDLSGKITPLDNLIIYYSGHGHFDTQSKMGYWIPVNGGLDNDFSSYVSNANVIHFIKNINSLHTLLIIDSCFSGTMITQHRGSNNLEHFRSRRVFASGREEVVQDGIPGANSPFARGIIHFLKGNAEKNVRTSTLIEEVKKYVEKNAQQTPIDARLLYADDAGGEFVFHRRITEDELFDQLRLEPNIHYCEKYFEYFPNGRYTSAIKQIQRELLDDQAWADTLVNGTLDDFQVYLRDFPDGRHIEDAHDRLKAAIQQKKTRQKIAEKAVQKAEELQQIKQKYGQLVYEAEELFRKKQISQARQIFYLALGSFVDGYGFQPAKQEVEQRLELIANLIKAQQHFRSGEQAFANKNYQEALTFFKKAEKLNPELNTSGYIEQCNEKMTQPKSAPFQIKKVTLGKPDRETVQKVITTGRKLNAPMHQVSVSRGGVKPVIYKQPAPEFHRKGRKHRPAAFYIMIVFWIVAIALAMWIITALSEY